MFGAGLLAQYWRELIIPSQPNWQTSTLEICIMKWNLQLGISTILQQWNERNEKVAEFTIGISLLLLSPVQTVEYFMMDKTIDQHHHHHHHHPHHYHPRHCHGIWDHRPQHHSREVHFHIYHNQEGGTLKTGQILLHRDKTTMFVVVKNKVCN